jgi:ABC-2 type transport system permease protein
MRSLIMSATSATLAAPAAAAAPALHTSHPSFPGMLRGELLKIRRMRTAWIMALLVAGAMVLPFLVRLTIPGFKDALAAHPLDNLYIVTGNGLTVLRVFSGTLLIIVTAQLIGMEYSGGTIRILLSRGVGRLQLFGAKLVTLALVALAILVVGVLLDFLLTSLVLLAVAGNLDALKAIDGAFWSNTGLFVLTVAISMGVTILMAACITAVTRSLAFGLAAGISFFAADNIGLIFFFLMNAVTRSDVWLKMTSLLLGPNLNAMPAVLLPTSVPARAVIGLQPPLVNVDGRNTLVVTLVWALIFVVSATIPTWRRDVTE